MHDSDPLTASVAQHLRALPNSFPEPYGWEEFRRRAERGARRAPAAARGMQAAIAVLCLAATIVAWRWSTPPTRNPIVGPVYRPDAIRILSSQGDDPALQAQLAERWLASQPPDPAVVHVGAYAPVAGLEDRIAQLDDLISAARIEGAQPAAMSALAEQRARLVSSLAQVRYAEALVRRP